MKTRLAFLMKIFSFFCYIIYYVTFHIKQKMLTLNIFTTQTLAFVFPPTNMNNYSSLTLSSSRYVFPSYSSETATNNFNGNFTTAREKHQKYLHRKALFLPRESWMKTFCNDLSNNQLSSCYPNKILKYKKSLKIVHVECRL
uniref:Uncharacterized protein n=1 Tax=Cacopsylla melanoneura TaxID=428564 RepID=A0A8D8RGH8_9HEMI